MASDGIARNLHFDHHSSTSNFWSFCRRGNIIVGRIVRFFIPPTTWQLQQLLGLKYCCDSLPSVFFFQQWVRDWKPFFPIYLVFHVVFILVVFLRVLNQIHKCHGSTQCSQSNTSPLNKLFIRSKLGTLGVFLARRPPTKIHGSTVPGHSNGLFHPSIIWQHCLYDLKIKNKKEFQPCCHLTRTSLEVWDMERGHRFIWIIVS